MLTKIPEVGDIVLLIDRNDNRRMRDEPKLLSVGEVVSRYSLFGSSDDNIHYEGELIDLAKYFRSLQGSGFYRLAILDRETQQLIRWDMLMAQTWFYPL